LAKTIQTLPLSFVKGKQVGDPADFLGPLKMARRKKYK